MASNVVQFDEDVINAVKSLSGDARGDKSERFLVLGYETPSKLRVVATGEGGLAEVKSHLSADDANYVLLRKMHQVEMAHTVKIAFVDWTPDGVKPMRKAMLSTHKQQVEQQLKPFHVSLQASEEKDLDEEVIQKKIAAASGTAVHVTNREVQKKAEQKSNVFSSVTASRDLRLDGDEIKLALGKIRADTSKWAVIGYGGEGGADISSLVLLASGGPTDDLSVLLTTLASFGDRVLYGLFRVELQFDKSNVVKFGCFKVLSDGLPPVKRAQISTHRGFIQSLMEPFSEEWMVDRVSELSVNGFVERFQTNMGTKSRVMTEEEVKHRQDHQNANKAAAKVGPSMPHGSAAAAIKLEDEAEFKAAIESVHKDGGADWVVAKYGVLGPASLGEVAKSQSSGADLAEIVNALKSALPADAAMFAVLRTTEKIDRSVTTKFVYIKWVPEQTPIMQKARISTVQGAIDQLFSPFHVVLAPSSVDDISAEGIVDLIATASGAKSHIKA